jgi:hypothetical protein
MSPKEKVEIAWQRVMDHLASLNRRAPDAAHSPMSSRFFLADAKELVGDAAVLMALLHLDDALVAVEACLWEWVKDAPDHWSAQVEGTSLTMAVWPALGGLWNYEIFDGGKDQDEPVHRGTSRTFDGACKSAEKQLTLYEVDPSG